MRLVVTSLALALVASACSGAAAPSDGATASERADTPPCTPSTDELPVPAADPAPDTVFYPWDAIDVTTVEGFDTSEVLPGGPPPDGILPIDAPCVESVAAADTWLTDPESVLVVEVGDVARAYPLAIMTQHEIVNDELGGEPLTVTYCPLCNSGIAFERTLDGEAWSFGTSGRLLRSNLVMYDRQTRTLWSQFTGEALWGDPAVVGRELVRVPTQTLGWATFREAFPDGTVLSRDSVPGRAYGANPYPSYEDNPSSFLFRGERSDALSPDERVVGVGDDQDAVAVPLSVLMEDEAVTVEVGGRALTIVWTPGQVSALDSREVADGREVGQTGAFAVDGLEPMGDGRFRDPATDAVHDVTGRTLDGNAPSLEAVALDDTFWFVWFAFRPDTRIAG